MGKECVWRTLFNYPLLPDHLSHSQFCDKFFHRLHLNKIDYQEKLL
jgi:hypothetical protein